jgi:hypothetical protein
MNERLREILEDAEVIFDNPDAHVPLALVSMEDFKLIAELIVRECALIAGLMEHEGRSNIGAQILDNFGVAQSNIEAAERIHSDKGYSLGMPEAQEAFDSKRGYIYDKSN